jgi:uncharacterized protein (TIGR02284 family)
MNNDKAISVLNNLIETCKDGEYGFKAAAEGVSDNDTRLLFQQFSQQRAGMARELQGEVRRLGGDPEKSGSVSGAAHRGWINIKSAVTGKDEGAIVAEAERGEDSAKKAYEDALSQGILSTQTQALIRQQSSIVHSTHDRVRSLERAVTGR